MNATYAPDLASLFAATIHHAVLRRDTKAAPAPADAATKPAELATRAYRSPFFRGVLVIRFGFIGGRYMARAIVAGNVVAETTVNPHGYDAFAAAAVASMTACTPPAATHRPATPKRGYAPRYAAPL